MMRRLPGAVMSEVPMDGREPVAMRGRRERWWRSVFLVVATVYVSLLLVGLLLRVLGGFAQIALIVFMAWLLAFVLSPVVAFVDARTRLSRATSIGIVYALTFVGSGFLLFYAVSSIGSSMAEMAADFPRTRERVEATLASWQAAISFGRFNPDLIGLYRDVEATAVRVGSSALGEVPAVTVAVLGALVLVVILSLYMLADSEAIVARLKRFVPMRYQDEAEILERTISQAFGGFLRAQVILAGLQTAITIPIVLFLGLPYGFIIVALAALAMLIPFFGPPLALVPPIVATALFAPGWLLVVAPLLLVIQTVLVNYLQPRLMREALGMHPILVLVGLLVGAQVAGVWGALFGIPVIAVLNVFVNYAVNLRTIDETPAVELDEVLDEVRREEPEASHEELVAIAADRVEAVANSERPLAPAGEAPEPSSTPSTRRPDEATSGS